MVDRRKLSQQEAFDTGISYQYVPSAKLGPWATYSLFNDPKHMAFVLARYKFCAKMLDGKRRVLEIGCGDALGIPIVAQHVDSVHGIDREARIIPGNRKRLSTIKNVSFQACDMAIKLPSIPKDQEAYDACYSIDVIEHLDRNLNHPFMANQCRCLTDDGVCIVGTPNITADKYASPQSKIQHINLKSHTTLRALMEKYFRNVFMFSMNDEVVHTGYGPMAHFLFAMGVGVKR